MTDEAKPQLFIVSWTNLSESIDIEEPTRCKRGLNTKKPRYCVLLRETQRGELLQKCLVASVDRGRKSL